jgi:hypothetical protein
MYYFILTRACCTRVGGSTSVRVHSFVTKRLEDESYATCRPGEDSDGATLHLIYQAMCVRAVWVRDRSIYRFVLLSIGTCRPVLTLSPCGLINFSFKKKRVHGRKRNKHAATNFVQRCHSLKSCGRILRGTIETQLTNLTLYRKECVCVYMCMCVKRPMIICPLSSER